VLKNGPEACDAPLSSCVYRPHGSVYFGCELSREQRERLTDVYRWWLMEDLPDESHCARCRRPNPDAEDGGMPDYWEVLVDGDGEVVGVICEDCITPEEQQATDEDMFELADEVSGLSRHCTRCLKPVPYATDDPGEPLPSGWKTLDHDDAVLLVLCPDCIHPDHELVK
jgi:hypothetical protein